ncbi:MAG: polysaccharide deacetylase family protein [Deltaproteobacteria bacterium]|nr:polysaccharide deacetylase family protein [Deltaproteobacteria bacterium]
MRIAQATLGLATVAALAALGWSALADPPRPGAALLAASLWTALCTAGVVFFRAGMLADVLCRGPAGARGVALTFDDGPDPEHTPRVLDLLDRFGARAAFFVIGRKAEQHPELVRAIARRGHALGIHGYAHDRLMSLRWPGAVRRDLERALGAVQGATGERPRMFRPPVGPLSQSMARVLRRFGLRVVGWSVRGLDGRRGARPERVVRRVVPRLRHGAIVLLHDAAEYGDREPAGVQALPEILAAVARAGLGFARVDQWLEVGGADAQRLPETGLKRSE